VTGPDELPPVDATTAAWWQATEERRLVLQRCPVCAAVQHPPRAVCTWCGADEPVLVAASGAGVVDAWTVVRRAPAPGFRVPYVLARVRLEEGPLLLTTLEAQGPEGWRCGAPVQVSWRALDDGRQLPVFVPRGG